MRIGLSVILVLILSSFNVLADDTFDSKLKHSEQLLQTGQYHLALDELNSIESLADNPDNPDKTAETQGLLGLIHYRMHHYQDAESQLQRAINSKRGQNTHRAHWYIALATLKNNQQESTQAQQLYSEAAKLTHNNPELSISIALGQSQQQAAEQHLTTLESLYQRVNQLSSPAARVPLYLNIAAQIRSIRADKESSNNTAGLKLAYGSLSSAKQLINNQQPRYRIETLDGLAQLYEEEKRLDEALHLNGQAIQSARAIQADDLLIDLEWRQGRLYRAKAQRPEAIAAYERAVEHIEAVRQDIPVEYHNGRSSFRETLEPVYLGLADLLLQEAEVHSGDSQAHLLHQARDTVELIKQSELADFLGGRCAIANASQARLDNVSSGTAVLYPIILPERLELLVSIGSEVKHFSQPISAANLQGNILSFAHSLRFETDNAEAASKALYELLIKPLEATLQAQQIQTLVWVPDGMLRLISPAALYDGEHYLIEKFAIATSPGLSLLASEAIQPAKQQALLAGLSEPGPVIDRLPALWAKGISSSRGIQSRNHKSRALNISKVELNSIAQDCKQGSPQRTTTNNPTRQQELKQALSLPGVTEEMHKLQAGLNNTLLLNESFTVANFKQQLLQQPYSVVHIASHGVFGNSADNSFLMAYDNLITMNELETLLRSDKFKQQPVQLLTLSACQTAEGDDRAPLGLSGIALKSKVRSALGSLWPVDDAAASELMAAFYQNLGKPDVNKAQALQQAQLSLLKQAERKHPYYWSPFILVGNWL